MRRIVGSIKWLGPKHYQLQVSVTTDGKRRRISRNGRGDAKAAEKHLAALLVQQGNAEAASDMTLHDYLQDVWLPELDVRPNTEAGYLSKLNTHVEPDLGHVPLCDLDGPTLQVWLGKLRKRGVSNATAAHTLSILGNALRSAVRKGLIPFDPTQRVEPPRVKRKKPSLPDLETFNAIINAFAGHVLEPIVVLATATGMRRSELAALEWSDVDLVNGTVRVWRGLHRNQLERGLVYLDPKSENSQRTISLPSWALEALCGLAGDGYLVRGRGSRPMSPDAISHMYRERLEEAGVTYVPLKNLRHAHVTLMLEAGAPLRLVSERAGHAEQAVTERHYVEVRGARSAEAAAYAERLRQLPTAAENGDERGSQGTGASS